MKELLPLAEDIETTDMSIFCGMFFIAMEMRTLYLVVINAVTNFMRGLLTAYTYLNLHVKVSPGCAVYDTQLIITYKCMCVLVSKHYNYFI